MVRRKASPYSPRDGNRRRKPPDAMSFEANHLIAPQPLPTQPFAGPLRAAADLFRAPDAAASAFDETTLAVDPEQVDFDLDPSSVRTSDAKTGQWNTSYEASGEMSVAAPGGEATTVPVRYEVTLRNENATPDTMRAVNPFDPASIPLRTRIEVHGADYAGTALEPTFRALADANDLGSIDDLRLSLEMTADGELRVMSGSEKLFDAPRDGGPGSDGATREDFTRHTTMLDDPAGADLAAYNRMLLTGQVPDDTVVTSEDVVDGAVNGTVTEAGSGEVNDITWTLDDEGRPTAAEATLSWEPSSEGRDSDRIEASAQSRFRSDNDMKGTGDDVGHVFAYRFVNGHGSVNMFPQFGLFNRGAYAQMEQEWSGWIDNGMDVRIEIDLVHEGSHRPTEVHVDYEVVDPATGKVVYDPALIAFANSDGQSFDAIAESGMDDIIDRANA